MSRHVRVLPGVGQHAQDSEVRVHQSLAALCGDGSRHFVVGED